MSSIPFENLSKEGQEFLTKVADQLRKVHVERNALIDLIESQGDYWTPERINFGSYRVNQYKWDPEKGTDEIVGGYDREISGEIDIQSLNIDSYCMKKVDTDQPIDVDSFWYASDQDC